ncbi:hypothetical protein B5X24_HaOG202463 [Helicoverpa armigera]|uniref:Uncharacterized protein n=1 Tax=Helicoverpa armigera TaxID=29058 RepID=A0A2W1BT12_HELAM|nr:hypothetical protein B5X24_HaOG202463 [Helicoverpa armigera]
MFYTFYIKITFQLFSVNSDSDCEFAHIRLKRTELLLPASAANTVRGGQSEMDIYLNGRKFQGPKFGFKVRLKLRATADPLAERRQAPRGTVHRLPSTRLQHHLRVVHPEAPPRLSVINGLLST